MKKYILITILLSSIFNLHAQEIPYGNNSEAGKYVQSEDAKIYYEIYGEGEPLLLLHGGYYGYISEFEMYFPSLIENFQVIAVATRGHGKSEIGTQDMSYELFAKDAISILKQEGIESANVMGFSDGGITGVVMAAKYPAFVKKLVCMGGGLNSNNYRPKSLQQIWEMSGETEEKNIPAFLNERKKIMPEPERFAEWVDMLKQAWLTPIWISDEAAAGIECPVLIVSGDRDDYMRTEAMVDMYQLIENAQLLIWPNSGHVNLILNPVMLNEVIIPFLK